MEALGAGANAVAFILLAAKLSKELYSVLYSIKDGPSNVQSVANDILRLHGALELLKNCPMVAHDTSLSGHIMGCISDLNPLAESIKKLQITSGEQRVGRIWKRFRSVLDEKKLDQIRTRVDAHTNAIHLRLSFLQSLRLHDISSDVRLGRRSITDLSGTIDQQFNNQASAFTALNQSLRFIQTSQQEVLQPHLTSIQAAVENASSMSRSDADTMIDLLGELKGLIVSQNGTQTKNQLKSPLDCQHENRGRTEEKTERMETSDDSLVLSITRLCNLIKENAKSFDTDAGCDTQAEDIIEDLQNLIRAAQRSAKAGEGDAELRSDLRRFDKAFGQYSLVVNPDKYANKLGRTVIRQKRKYTSFELDGLGTVSLIMTKGTKTTHGTESGNSTQSISRAEDKMMMSFLPKDRREFSMLVASTIRRWDFGNAVQSISSLAVNRVLPATAPVFDVIRNGRLRELQAMLRRGEASLRDHDEYGASLLFYSTENLEMCRFLLSNGLDVDLVADGFGVIGIAKSIMVQVLDLDMIDDDYEYEDVKRRIECRTLLLEAGADPTLHTDDSNFLAGNINSGTVESIQAIWGSALIQPFTHINDIISGVGIPLLFMCENLGYGFTEERLSLLLRLGADIQARDSMGRSCLHICFQNLRLRSAIQEFAAIRVLIQNGADIHARDENGDTAYQAAYRGIYSYYDVGSKAGDLWDCLLQDCGYDIRQFRKDHQRRAVYVEKYTREDFEKLWSGRESQCPYWDDTPWPEEAPWRGLVGRYEPSESTAGGSSIGNESIEDQYIGPDDRDTSEELESDDESSQELTEGEQLQHGGASLAEHDLYPW
ncbi:ankyrin [Xylaria digitata]|nr:ankyrin [Xylaria digitata]